jgi:hypothetical protein
LAFVLAANLWNSTVSAIEPCPYHLILAMQRQREADFIDLYEDTHPRKPWFFRAATPEDLAPQPRLGFIKKHVPKDFWKLPFWDKVIYGTEQLTQAVPRLLSWSYLEWMSSNRENLDHGSYEFHPFKGIEYIVNRVVIRSTKRFTSPKVMGPVSKFLVNGASIFGFFGGLVAIRGYQERSAYEELLSIDPRVEDIRRQRARILEKKGDVQAEVDELLTRAFPLGGQFVGMILDIFANAEEADKEKVDALTEELIAFWAEYVTADPNQLRVLAEHLEALPSRDAETKARWKEYADILRSEVDAFSKLRSALIEAKANPQELALMRTKQRLNELTNFTKWWNDYGYKQDPYLRARAILCLPLFEDTRNLIEKGRRTRSPNIRYKEGLPEDLNKDEIIAIADARINLNLSMDSMERWHRGGSPEPFDELKKRFFERSGWFAQLIDEMKWKERDKITALRWDALWQSDALDVWPILGKTHLKRDGSDYTIDDFRMGYLLKNGVSEDAILRAKRMSH